MLFSSATFLFLFLPIVCLIYLLVRRELKNSVLLAASIVFYAWGEPVYLAIMLLTILINYGGALCLGQVAKGRKWILAGTIILNISFLFYFKYFNFVADNVSQIFSTQASFVDVIMPIGISFYTFQAMSYLIDVYRGEVPVQRDLYKLALYISLFPQLIAGPIVKYHDVAHQIDKREISLDRVVLGVKRFILGLGKKMLIANTLGAVVDKIFALPPDQLDTATVWMGALFYALQLYFDFSGYSDMAIGLGLIFGFKFLENFNYPYISKSITEFWRRWHISLSTWFKEYLYIPLGGNRKGGGRTYFNLFLVFLATGIWHGAEWTFVIWGLWHGFFIILEKITHWHGQKAHPILRLAQHSYTILIFLFGWVIFRSPDLNYAFSYICNMLGVLEKQPVPFALGYYVGNIEMMVFGIAVLLATPICSKLLYLKNHFVNAMINVWLLLIFILSAAAIASSTYNPFIYFRF